jgi:hypothetical protein
MLRRQRAGFRVDTVGNGYAASIHVSVTRGRLRAAADHARTTDPIDPSFSMTSAAALAQTAVLTADPALSDRAAIWSRRGTIPLLGYLPTAIELASAILAGPRERERAADAAERYWDEAVAVPVSRINWLAQVDVALLDAGRTTVVASQLAEAAALVADMVDAPLCEALILQGRARLALATGHLPEALDSTALLLDLATGHGFTLLVVDAVELAAVALHRGGSEASAAILASAARRHRQLSGHHWVALPSWCGLRDLGDRPPSSR